MFVRELLRWLMRGSLACLVGLMLCGPVIRAELLSQDACTGQIKLAIRPKNGTYEFGCDNYGVLSRIRWVLYPDNECASYTVTMLNLTHNIDTTFGSEKVEVKAVSGSENYFGTRHTISSSRN